MEYTIYRQSAMVYTFAVILTRIYVQYAMYMTGLRSRGSTNIQRSSGVFILVEIYRTLSKNRLKNKYIYNIYRTYIDYINNEFYVQYRVWNQKDMAICLTYQQIFSYHHQLIKVFKQNDISVYSVYNQNNYININIGKIYMIGCFRSSDTESWHIIWSIPIVQIRINVRYLKALYILNVYNI